MPNHCVAPGCKTNYSSCSAKKMSVFSAPKDEKRRLAWQYAIPRKNFVLKPSHYLCEKHFFDDDIIRKIVHKDHLGNTIAVGIYKRPKLKDDAIPKVFPGCPAHLSRLISCKRSKKSHIQVKEQESHIPGNVHNTDISPEQINTTEPFAADSDMEIDVLLPPYNFTS